MDFLHVEIAPNTQRIINLDQVTDAEFDTSEKGRPTLTLVFAATEREQPRRVSLGGPAATAVWSAMRKRAEDLGLQDHDPGSFLIG